MSKTRHPKVFAKIAARTTNTCPVVNPLGTDIIWGNQVCFGSSLLCSRSRLAFPTFGRKPRTVSSLTTTTKFSVPIHMHRFDPTMIVSVIVLQANPAQQVKVVKARIMTSICISLALCPTKGSCKHCNLFPPRSHPKANPDEVSTLLSYEPCTVVPKTLNCELSVSAKFHGPITPDSPRPS